MTIYECMVELDEISLLEGSLTASRSAEIGPSNLMPARMKLFCCLYVVHPWRESRNPGWVLIRDEQGTAVSKELASRFSSHSRPTTSTPSKAKPPFKPSPE